MVVMADEVSDLLFEITGQLLVLEQDKAFPGLVPALDLALGLGMHRRTTGMVHALIAEPISQFTRDVTGTIIAEQAWLMKNTHITTA
jgi:hypothetical protein